MNKLHYISILLTALLWSACLKEGVFKKPYVGFAPIPLGDGWTISTPKAEQLDSLALDQVFRDVYADDATWMMKSLLVFRNGKLVAESYLKDEADRTTRAAVWSCTKQVTGIITGIAIDQGYIGGVKDSIGKHLPDYLDRHPDKKGITLEHLLTMSSGLAFYNGKAPDVLRQHKTDNSIDFILGLDQADPIGTRFHYNDGDPHLVSAVVQRATGFPLDAYGKQVLFDRIGFTNYEWVRYSDGVTIGAFGILTTPRELAKIGACVLDSGRYQGQQVIPLSWWHEMLSAHVENAHDDAAFGYYWWSIPAKDWYFMWGHGGQYVFLQPSKRLMVVATSLPQVEDDFALWYEDIVRIAEQVSAAAQ